MINGRMTPVMVDSQAVDTKMIWNEKVMSGKYSYTSSVTHSVDKHDSPSLKGVPYFT